MSMSRLHEKPGYTNQEFGRVAWGMFGHVRWLEVRVVNVANYVGIKWVSGCGISMETGTLMRCAFLRTALCGTRLSL
jgi:hypothetical protein